MASVRLLHALVPAMNLLPDVQEPRVKVHSIYLFDKFSPL